jgi:hypothetical protein
VHSRTQAAVATEDALKADRRPKEQALRRVRPIRTRLRIWHVAALVAYLAVILGALRAIRPDKQPSIGEWLLLAVFLALTSTNLAGPIRAIGQFSRRGELFAGEILWAWLGVAWIVLLIYGTQSKLVGLMILSMSLAIGVAVFGLHPQGRDGAWANHVGWVLLAVNIAFHGISFVY